MIETPERKHAHPPALTAMLVYLRPAPRRELLGLLADLGIFVVEHQRLEGAAALADSVRPDVVLVVADASPQAVSLVAALGQAGARAVMASLPEETDPAAFAAAGAVLCLNDEELGPGSMSLFAAVANRARGMRTKPETPGGVRVFGDLLFDPSLPALQRNGEHRNLSRSERAVLARLLATPGRPVEISELERCATPPGTSVHPGFLKAVILRLRRKVEDLGGQPDLLRTVRGFGYSLAAASAEMPATGF